MHFIFTIQNHPLTTLSHAVHKLFELQRLIPVHKALAKAFLNDITFVQSMYQYGVIISPKIHKRSILNFIRQKLRLAAAEMAQS